jgi:hypothetical protein
MTQTFTKTIAIIATIIISISGFTQTTLTYSSGTWTPYAPSGTTGSDNAIVDDLNCRTVNGAVINNLTINAGKSMNQGVRSLTVNGDLTMLYPSSIAFSTGTITVLGTTNISITGNNSDAKYNAWSSPFSGPLDLLNTFIGSNPCDIYAFQASDQTWRYDYSVPYSTTCNGNAVTITSASALNGVDGIPDGNFDIGRGYFSPGNVTSTRILSSTSQLNTGTINVPVYGSSVAVAGGNDWNLIGNPYPSPIRAGDFLSTNSSLVNAVYIYKGNTGGYITYGTGSSNQIPSTQGFFIEATSVVDGFLGNIQFLNSHRRASNTLFCKTEDSISKTFFSLSSDGLSDQIQILLHDDCLDGYDNKFEARKLMNNHNLNLASLIEYDPIYGPEPYVFNGIKSMVDKESKVIDLFVQTNKPGTFELKLDSVRNLPLGISIVLEDKETSSMTNLRTNEYSFTTQVSDTLENRFYIHFSYDASITSVEDFQNSKHLNIYSQNQEIIIHVLTNNFELSNVEIFDVLGKQIKTRRLTGLSATISTSSLPSSIYIVKVTDSNGNIYTQRVLIK